MRPDLSQAGISPSSVKLKSFSSEAAERNHFTNAKSLFLPQQPRLTATACSAPWLRGSALNDGRSEELGSCYWCHGTDGTFGGLAECGARDCLPSEARGGAAGCWRSVRWPPAQHMACGSEAAFPSQASRHLAPPGASVPGPQTQCPLPVLPGQELPTPRNLQLPAPCE